MALKYFTSTSPLHHHSITNASPMHQEYFTSASSNSIFHIQMQTFGSAKISPSQAQHLPTDTVCIDDQPGAN
jgi:hypothetical protein